MEMTMKIAVFGDLVSCYLLSELRIRNLEGFQMVVNK